MIEELLEKIQKLMRSNSNSTALARDVGVTRQVIDKYKKGKSKLKNMTAENLMKFEKYMEENKMNINKIENKEYIWEFEQLGEFLDEENNFLERKEFDWWKELADSLAFMDEKGIDVLGLEANELQDYIDISKKHRGADRLSHEALQSVYFDEGNGTYDLEFLVNGEKHYKQVQASDHPEAATNEGYFDDKLVVDKIIMEIPED